MNKVIPLLMVALLAMWPAKSNAQMIPGVGSPMIPNASSSGGVAGSIDAGGATAIANGVTNGVLFQNSSNNLANSANFTYVDPGQLTLAQGTITTNQKALNITATWNNAGTKFDAPLFMNVTNTASADLSNLVDIQSGGATAFAVVSRNDTIFGPQPAKGIMVGVNGFYFEDRFGNANFNVASGFSAVFLTVGPQSFLLGTSNVPRWSIDGSIGHWLPQGGTNTKDIGASGNAIRSLYAGTSANLGVSGTGSNGSATSANVIASLATGSGTPGDMIFQTGFQGISSTGTATFSNGSAIIAYVNTFVAGQAVQFTTTGTLPTNFATATTYYVVSAGLSGTQFEVSATQGVGNAGIIAGSPGTGTQTVLTATVQQGAVTAMTIKGGTQYVNVAAVGTSATPSLSVGNVTTGFYSVSTTGLGISVNGSVLLDFGIGNTGQWSFRSNVNMANNTFNQVSNVIGNTASSYELKDGTASSTNPTLIPNRADLTTGIGTQASGNTSMIVGGAEIGRWVSTGLNMIVATDASASSGSGALQVPGGASVAKRFWLPAITTSAGFQTAVLCQSSGGEVIADSVACLASAARFKEGFASISDMSALDTIVSLWDRGHDRALWNYQRDPGSVFPDAYYRQRIGFVAEDAASIDPRLASFEPDGRVHADDYNAIVTLQTGAIRALKADNDHLAARVEYLERRIAR